MKTKCKNGKYTSGKIECEKLKTICPFQRFRPCKNEYWHTDGALTCRAKSDDFKMEEKR